MSGETNENDDTQGANHRASPRRRARWLSILAMGLSGLVVVCLYIELYTQMRVERCSGSVVYGGHHVLLYTMTGTVPPAPEMRVLLDVQIRHLPIFYPTRRHPTPWRSVQRHEWKWNWSPLVGKFSSHHHPCYVPEYPTF